MTDITQISMQKPAPRPALPPDAYFLTIRQGPERAKVPAPKDRDRKPIDPQPILQLQINDPDDPAHNYLQSPYFFMCCSLLPADERSSEQISPETLVGATVSSLHRLKDIDNTDGGFFVFGDLQVMQPGHYRMHFSLFELVKTHVLFLKAAISSPFTAYPAKEFPGMSESTVLSRSFGDQGVKLKTRKEPRTLLKRSAPSRMPAQPVYHPAAPGYPPQNVGQMVPDAPYHFQSSGEVHLPPGSDYQGPDAKRRRTSLATAGSESQEPEPRYAPTYYTNHQPYSAAPAAYQPTSSQAQGYPREPYSATSGASDYSSGHLHTNSSQASSPYVSPHTTFTGYSSAAPSNYQPGQHSRNSSFHKPYQPDVYQEKYVPHLNYPTPPRQYDSPRKRKASNASWSNPAAEALIAMSHAPVNNPTAVRSEGTEYTGEGAGGAPIPSIERPTLPLPSVHSMMQPPMPGSEPQLGRGSSNFLPRIQIPVEVPRRPEMQPYQSYQAAPP